MSTILFSSSNEDVNSELRAFGSNIAGDVLCVTGSGSRAFDLLVSGPRYIVCVDKNPAQTFLAEITRSAFRVMSYDEFCAFMGLAPSRDRVYEYRRLRSELPAAAIEYWDNHFALLRRGILYAGKWERFFQIVSFLGGTTRAELRRDIFSANELSKQIELWRRWDDRIWKIFLLMLSWRPLWRYGIREPGINLIDANVRIAEYFHKRFTIAASQHLFSECPFASLIFYGRYDVTGALPPYLRRENFHTIKSKLNSLEFITASLDDYLRKEQYPKFDAFSLSDFSSYTSELEYDRTWQSVISRATRGARFCERQFLMRRVPNLGMARDSRLEKELEDRDKSFFYSFVAGSIN